MFLHSDTPHDRGDWIGFTQFAPINTLVRRRSRPPRRNRRSHSATPCSPDRSTPRVAAVNMGLLTAASNAAERLAYVMEVVLGHCLTIPVSIGRQQAPLALRCALLRIARAGHLESLACVRPERVRTIVVNVSQCGTSRGEQREPNLVLLTRARGGDRSGARSERRDCRSDAKRAGSEGRNGGKQRQRAGCRCVCVEIPACPNGSLSA